MPTALEIAMDYPNAARKNRLKAATWILNHRGCLGELLQIVLTKDSKLAEKAAWALEFSFLEDNHLIDGNIDYFFSNLHKPTRDPIARPLSHICEKLCQGFYIKRDPRLQQVITKTHREKLVEVAFDWLIGDYRVACKVRAMTCLHLLAGEINWIGPELSIILEQNLPRSTPGYRSRASKILAQIRRQ